MIIRPRPSFLALFFVMRGSIVPRIPPQIVGFAIYAALIVAVVRHFGLHLDSEMPTSPKGVMPKLSR